MTKTIAIINTAFPPSNLSHTMSALDQAVVKLRQALNEICNAQNYADCDPNDPNVQYCMRVFHNYMNDFEFHNVLQPPLPYNMQTSEHSHFGTLNALSVSSEDVITYHHSTNPHNVPNLPPIVSFPSFPILLTSLTPEKYLKFQLLGISFYKFLIVSALHSKLISLTPGEVSTIVESLSSIETLAMFSLKYGLVTFSTKPPHELFVVYLALYYETNLRLYDNWKEIYCWIERVLGLRDESVYGDYIHNEENKQKYKAHIMEAASCVPSLELSFPSQLAPSVSNSHSHSNSDTSEFLYEKKPSDHNRIDLNEYLKSVIQDINQSNVGTSSFLYDISDTPSLKDGKFKAVLTINDTEFSQIYATNKKLAKSGVSLLAALNPAITKYIKRNDSSFWNKKYSNNAELLLQKLREDFRFSFDEPNDTTNDPAGAKIGDTERANQQGESLSTNFEMLKIEEKYRYRHASSDLPTISMAKYMEDRSIDHSSKERLYAYLSSRLHVKPEYRDIDLGNCNFIVELAINGKRLGACFGAGKKIPAQILAQAYISQLKGRAGE